MIKSISVNINRVTESFKIEDLKHIKSDISSGSVLCLVKQSYRKPSFD